MRILVADDDDLFLKMVEDTLTGAGHEVVLASDGPETMEKVNTENPDLIVLDIILPGLLGTDICEKLKNHASTATIPILLVSSRFEKMEEDDELVDYFKADDFLRKPFQAEELLERVNQLSFSKR